jgi:hypothetical protein
MAINDTAIDNVIITGDFNDNQLDYSRTEMKFDNSIILMTYPYDYGLTMILKTIVFQSQRILL